MKQKIIYPLVFLLALMVSSCEGFLDQNPSTSLPSDDAVQTVTDLRNALNGAYTRLIDLDDFSHYKLPEEIRNEFRIEIFQVLVKELEDM